MTTAKKHLKSGSECPPLKENQLRLYSMRFCPFVRRTKLVLAAKNIPYEEVLINLSDEPDWYLKKNPVGEVPLLEWTDPTSKQTRSIPESLIISDYLENLYPENPLRSVDPYLNAKQQILIGKFGNVLPTFYKVFRKDGENAAEDLKKGLVEFEEALDGTFFGGSKPAMLDYMLWPWFEHSERLSEGGFVLPDDGELPKLAAWVKAMHGDEAVKKTKVPEEIVKRFMETTRQGTVNYDVE